MVYRAPASTALPGDPEQALALNLTRNSSITTHDFYVLYWSSKEINVISAILKLFPHLVDFICNFTEGYIIYITSAITSLPRTSFFHIFRLPGVRAVLPEPESTESQQLSHRKGAELCIAFAMFDKV